MLNIVTDVCKQFQLASSL